MLQSRSTHVKADAVSGKQESASLDAVIAEALEKMRQVTAGSSCYEVDRSTAHWTVRRASEPSEKGFPSHVVADLAAARRS
jgi:hypothetical protein